MRSPPIFQLERSLGIKHVQGVIGDAADECLELAFAFRKVGDCILTFGDVARDLREPDQLAPS